MSVPPSRLARYAAALERGGADAFVLTSEPAVQHATGIRLYTMRLIPQRPVACVLAPPGPPIIVCVTYEVDQLAAEHPELEVRPFRELGEDPWAIVADALRGAGANRIVIEDSMPAAWLEGSRRHLNGRNIELSYELPLQPRIIKDQEEIDILEEGSLAAERAIAAGADLVRPGVSEREIAGAIRLAFEQSLSSRASEVSGICIGPQSLDQMHHLAGPDLLPQAGPVRLGLVGRLDGYWILLTRMLLLGHDDQYEEVYAAYVSVYGETMATLLPGASTSELYEGCRQRLSLAGFELTSSKIGHGTGLDFRELPWIASRGESRLAPGMVLAYDFGTAPVGHYILHIEDRVLIGEKQPRCLSSLWNHADSQAGFEPALR